MKIRIFSLTLIILILAAPIALAANPHFIYANGSLDKDGALVVNWKEAGLGANQNIDYTLTADATAVWGCINKGGNHPQASNKETVAGPVGASGTFASGKNGQITASLTAGPLPMPVGFSCPTKNMVIKLVSISYTNIVLKDTTTPVDAPAIPDQTAVYYQ